MKQLLKIYILDDDPVILGGFTDALTAYLAKMPQYDVQITRFTGGRELLQHLSHAKSLDLLLTDIDLGRSLSGIDIARQVRAKFPLCAIIYLTAYPDYVTEIFETRPLYFIRKDQYRQRIPMAMDLFFQQYGQSRAALTVVCGREKRVLPLEDIRYLQHTERRTLIHTCTETLDVKDSIPKLIEQLPEDRFVWCHRSYVVALDQVKQFQRFELQLLSGEVLPISRAKYNDFLRAFTERMK